MVRNYKKTTTRGYYGTAALKEELYKVREGQPVAKSVEIMEYLGGL